VNTSTQMLTPVNVYSLYLIITELFALPGRVYFIKASLRLFRSAPCGFVIGQRKGN
jgi:hypothetical protein